MTHAEHTIETGWSPVNADAMRATCRDCGATQEAGCSDSTEYVTIRRSQQQATAWLAETCCVEKCRARRLGVAA